MGIALSKLAEEDPTFRTWTDEETGQTIIAGMGELHLQIIVERMLREFKVEANIGKPQVAYKETIRKKVDQETKYKRQSGGSGQYGHVKITIEPNEPGKGYEFVNAVVGGSIPKEFIPAVDAGIQGAMQNGVLAGYNVVDVKVTLYGVQGGYAQGGSRADRACHEGRYHCAGRVHGRCHRRLQLPSRSDQQHGGRQRRSRGDYRICPAVQYVRLCYRPALQDAGTRHLLYGAQPLR